MNDNGSTSFVCKKCGHSEVDRDESFGHVVCLHCGNVIEESTIVNETAFAQGQDGSSELIGNYVSSDTIGQGNPEIQRHLGYRNHRLVVERKGFKEIERVCAQLGARSVIEPAGQYFKRALQNRLTRGRRITYVLGACLYLACRQQNLPYMLIDFADALDIDVFHLGKAYQIVTDSLNIPSHTIDPTIYIQRFASKLDFGDATHDVAEMAVRLVKRMKSDWLDTGRRPTGLCGAALYIAAKSQDFSIQFKDITRVAKIGQSTIRKRLDEFESTNSASLSIEDFNKFGDNIESWGESSDPPSYAKNRELLEKKLDQWEQHGDDLHYKTQKLATLIDQSIEKSTKTSKQFTEKEAFNLAVSVPNPEAAVTNIMAGDLQKNDITSADGRIDVSKIEHLRPTLKDYGVEKSATEQFINAPESLDDVETSVIDTSPVLESMVVDQDISSEPTASIPPSLIPSKSSNRETFSDISDSEIDQYLLTPEDVKVKTAIWDRENGVIYAKLLVREKERAEELVEKQKRAEEDIAKNVRTKFKRKITKRATTTGEAIATLINSKKLSKKVNYDVLKSTLGTLAQKNISVKRNNPYKQKETEKLIEGKIMCVKKVKVDPVVNSWEPATPVSVLPHGGYSSTDEGSSEDEEAGTGVASILQQYRKDDEDDSE